MYFDFYDDYPDYLDTSRDVIALEGKLHLILAIMVAFFVNVVSLIVLIVLPQLVGTDLAARRAAEQAALRVHPQEPTRFVFMSPRVEMAPPRQVAPRAEASDRDRMAMAPEHARDATNPLPFSRGNTPERVDQPGSAAQRMARNEPPAAQPSPQQGQNGQNGQNGSQSLLQMPGGTQAAARSTNAGMPGAPGALGEALRNPQRYMQGESFENPGGGGGQYGPAIQFDSKGVDFGPWLRRFIAQIKRNWFIPYAAMAMKGHVVITFNVHKNGGISDLSVAGPCNVDAFNNAAFNALAASNPTQPLPPEYPTEKAFFTVTFFYNEAPPMQQ